MTIDEVVAAFRALSVPERLRVIELLAHDAANGTSIAHGDSAVSSSAILAERHGLLLVDTQAALPEAAFDHRADREAMAHHTWNDS